MIVSVITEVLIKQHHFSLPAIHLFGFGQGGSLGLSVPLSQNLSSLSSLEGAISVGGALPLSANHLTNKKSRTPVCLLGGSRGAFATDEQSPVKRLRNVYEFVEYHQWKKADDSMPKDRDEVLPMVQFFARRLRDRRGVPDGFVDDWVVRTGSIYRLHNCSDASCSKLLVLEWDHWLPCSVRCQMYCGATGNICRFAASK